MKIKVTGKIPHKLVACSECYMVKIVYANSIGSHIYCGACKKSVLLLPIESNSKLSISNDIIEFTEKMNKKE